MVTVNNLRKFTKKHKKARTANTTKIKYQRPTARNQKSQIMTNARVISKLYRAVMTKRVFCDWQYVGQAKSQGYDPTGFTREWYCFPLTDYASWGPVLRRDENVDDSSTTFVQRMCINMRYQLQKSSYAQYNVWIVTSRKDASNIDWPARIATGVAGYPVVGQEYIEGPDAFNMRLNSAMFKVHFASYKTLTESTLFLNAQQPAGNPYSTFSKGQANLQCKINVRRPSTIGAWTSLPYMEQAYSKRYFMLVCMVGNHNVGVGPGSAAEFTFDSLATTINNT